MRPRPRVLWLSKGLNRGGVEVLLQQLASQPVMNGFDLHVATVLSDHDQMRAEFDDLGVVIHDLGGRRSTDVRWMRNLRHLIVHEDFDIVHSHSPLPASIARLIVTTSPSVRSALVCTDHNVRALYRPPTRYLNDLTSRLDTERIAVSKAASDSSVRWRRQSPHVIYHGTSPLTRNHDDRVEIRRELGLGAHDPVILSVANFRGEKNLPMLIRAFAVVAEQFPSAFLLLIGDGACRQEVEREIHRLQLHERVILTGFMADARRYMEVADLFALSSDFEGLPVACMEALHAALPIVGTAVGGMAELVTNGENGYLVRRGDEAGLAERMAQLLRNPDLLSQMRKSAAATAAQFLPDRAAKQHAELYSRLSAERH